MTGDCRSLYNCPNILSQIQGPLTVPQSNYLRSLKCANGFGQYPHVCCTFNHFYPPQPQSQPIQPFFQPEQIRRTSFQIEPIQNQNQNQFHNNIRPRETHLNRINGKHNIKSIRGTGSGTVLPGVGTCGLTGLANRIFGGESTQLDDYPWMALLEYQHRK